MDQNGRFDTLSRDLRRSYPSFMPIPAITDIHLCLHPGVWKGCYFIQLCPRAACSLPLPSPSCQTASLFAHQQKNLSNQRNFSCTVFSSLSPTPLYSVHYISIFIPSSSYRSRM